MVAYADPFTGEKVRVAWPGPVALTLHFYKHIAPLPCARCSAMQIWLAWTVSLEDGVFQEWLVEGAAPGPRVTNGRKPLRVPDGLGVPWARGVIKDELWNVGGNGSTVHEHRCSCTDKPTHDSCVVARGRVLDNSSGVESIR